jgi:hypothetical protein
VYRGSELFHGDHVSHRENLHRKAEQVQLHGTPIVSGKTMNRLKILNNIWSNNDIIKIKRTRDCRHAGCYYGGCILGHIEMVPVQGL